MILKEEDYLEHYGVLRKSGRYPWGSGGTESIRNKTFLDTIDDLKRQGLTDAQIAAGFHTKENPFNTSTLRAARAIALNQQRQEKINQAQRLRDKGWSNVKIGERMGINESSVRSLLEPGQKDKAEVLLSTADMLKRQVEEKGYVDVGRAVEHDLPLSDGGNVGISTTKFNTALALVQEQGYTIHYVKVPQLGTNNLTTIKVLAKPGTPYSEVYANRAKIKTITDFSEDGGRTYFGIQKPLVVSSSRVGVRYAKDGGDKADGVIYVRRGVDDLSLGRGNYAQVRIAVDGTHYIKGMAVYSDDMPKGVDLVFNTNKSDTGNKKDALKPLKDDPDNPFGAVVRQLVDKDGKVNSAMNIVNEEGDWDNWSRNLPSQMLSKQSPNLAKTQLAVTYERRRREFEEITALTNPAVRKRLLDSFADDADAASVHLKAAAIPRQTTKVLMPVRSVKETEIYAPSLRDGERVALVRFPHGGTFEIPQLTVNNRNPEAKKLLGPQAKDAVGIHWKVAERLSGADFDGDTALVIPNAKGEIKSSPALEGLKNFDPRSSFPAYNGMRTIDGGTYNATTKSVDYPKGSSPASSRKGHEMGNVTNLIGDMTVRGASASELARAVRHSMVVIDAEKHVLDYRASAKQNGITALKAKYQDNPRGGAATLITRATAQTRVLDRKPRPASEGGPIDKKTGKLVYVETGKTYTNKKGETVVSTFKSKQLAETDDATTLLSSPNGTPIERVYADHSNQLKALANDARRVSAATKAPPYSKSAKQTYSNEVVSLNAKLNVAVKNAPLERQAQVLANGVVAQKKAANPDMDPADLKKIKGQALTEMRLRTGAKKQRIDITPSEWDAIQAGAISNNKLSRILDNTDIETVRKLATPRTTLLMSSAKSARATSMLASGYTQAEVADALGVSLTTLKTSLGGA